MPPPPFLLSRPSSLGLSSRNRAFLAQKYSGRVLDDIEDDEEEAAVDRISHRNIADEDCVEDPKLDEELGITQQPYLCQPPEEDVLIQYEPSQQPVPPLSTLVREDLHHNKQSWREIFVEDGVSGLAKAVMQEEIEQRLTEKKALYITDLEWSAYVMKQLLQSTDRVLLESLLFGNLALDRQSNPALHKILGQLATRSANQPGIYYQSLVDSSGQSPSASELLRLCDLMMGYVKGCRELEVQQVVGTIDDELANRIDNFRQAKRSQITVERSRKGNRKYLNTRIRVIPSSDLISQHRQRLRGLLKGPIEKAATERLSRSHTKETVHFVERLRARLSSVPADDSEKPMQFPLIEVGYSKRCLNQLKSHARHNSSNYIMNLTEAIFASARGEFRSLYFMHQAVICLIWRSEQAEIAEIGLTKLAEGYIHNAGGFSHFPAGLSNHSAKFVPAREWNAASEYIMYHSPYLIHMRAETDALEAKVLRLEAMDVTPSTSVESQIQVRDAHQAMVLRKLRHRCRDNTEVLFDCMATTKIAHDLCSRKGVIGEHT